MLLYIHGFNSSPLSDKAVLTRTYIEQHFPGVRLEQPQLPTSPKAAMALLIQLTEAAKAKGEPLAFIGSSRRVFCLLAGGALWRQGGIGQPGGASL